MKSIFWALYFHGVCLLPLFLCRWSIRRARQCPQYFAPDSRSSNLGRRRWTTEITDPSLNILFGFWICLLAPLLPCQKGWNVGNLGRFSGVETKRVWAKRQSGRHNMDSYLHVICHLLSKILPSPGRFRFHSHFRWVFPFKYVQYFYRL
jgi:hypothetical protein